MNKIRQINNILTSARERFRIHSNGRHTYRLLLADTQLSNYFRRYYPLSEIPGIRKYLSRSKYYNPKFISKIESEIVQTRELFLGQLTGAADQYGTDFKVKVKDRELDVLDSILKVKLLPKLNAFTFPTPSDILNKMNLKASAGLPEPWFKKKDYITKISDISYSIVRGDFNLYDSLSDKELFSSAFKRFQITDSSMKARLVYCLTYVINVAEAYFDMALKQMFKHPDCPFVHGKTQLEISDIITRHSNLHCISWDVKSFDIKTPGEIIVLSFSYMSLYLGLSAADYKQKLLNDIRDLILCMPCFHPALQMTDRKRGISSGSGLTSSLGSFCMYIMHVLTFLKYCKLHRMNIFRTKFEIYVSSDDSMIFTDFKIKPELYKEIFHRTFDLELELEDTSEKNVNRAFFLGSSWIDGVPFRSKDRMFARILFGSSNIPKMDNDHVLFCSRCYDILGNVGDFESIWKTFQVPMSDRLFRFSELADYQLRERSKDRLDRRGFWESRDLSVSLDRIWTTR